MDTPGLIWIQIKAHIPLEGPFLHPNLQTCNIYATISSVGQP